MDNLFLDSLNSEERQPEDMAEKELLILMFKQVMEIHKYVALLKSNYDKIVSNIEIDSNTLQELVKMSNRTLSRWRSEKKIRYYVRSDGSLFYKFEELYVDVKSGRLDGKTFCRSETLSRMKAYYFGLLKGHKNHVEWDADVYGKI